MTTVRHISSCLLIFVLVACQTTKKTSESLQTSTGLSGPIRSLPDDSIWLDHQFFRILYSTSRNIAYFSEYTLTAQDLAEAHVERANSFRADPLLIERGLPAVSKNDYARSGYDRGHLAPSGDFRRSHEAEDSTNVMSNMVPQSPGLNRNVIKTLEEKVRTWATCEEKIHIVTGPVLEDGLESLKTSKTPLPIPRRTFKAVYDLTPPHKTIAFLLSQQDGKKEVLSERTTTVRDLEKIIGLDLFAHIADSAEYEATADLESWPKSKCALNAERAPTGAGTCSRGTLRSASIRGCCSGHGGVMGPKKGRACCDSANHVICNDGTTSLSCRCN